MKDIRIEKAQFILLEKIDILQDQYEICIYLTGFTDYIRSGATEKFF